MVAVGIAQLAISLARVPCQRHDPPAPLAEVLGCTHFAVVDSSQAQQVLVTHSPIAP